MAISTPPAAPNPLGTNFAAEALAFTQWMHTAAPEFNTAVSDANQAVLDAQTDGGAAVLAAETARDDAQGYATDADTARGLAVMARGLAEDARDAAQGFAGGAEDARDMAQTYAALAGASAGLPALAGQALKNLRVKSNESGVEWTAEAAPGSMARSAKTSAYTLAGADKGALIDCTGTWTLGADAAIAAGWWAYVRNAGNGDITIDPDSATVGGAATHVLKPGFTILLVRDATGFTAMTVTRRTYDRMEIITSNTSWVVPADMFVLRAYSVGKGGDGAAAASGGGGGMAFGDLAVTPGDTVSIAFASGVATVTAGGTTLLTANPASGVTAGTASKDASVTNGGAYSGGAGTATVIRGGASSGSPLGAGVAAGFNNGGAGWGGAGSSGGGGVGSAAALSAGGRGLRLEDGVTEPLLARLTAPATPGASSVLPKIDGGAGAGGNAAASSAGGAGGFGGGGGVGAIGASSAGSPGGAGGFGGGGGGGGAGGFGGGGEGGAGGAGGFGGGGGAGGNSGAGGVAGAGGVGGAAAVLLLY